MMSDSIMRGDVSVTTGDIMPINVVEDRLNDLWGQVAGKDDSNPLLKATTLNLVLYTTDGDNRADLLGQVAETHPHRAIVIETGQVMQDLIQATPSLYCHPSLGMEARNQVCCEEILIQAGSETLDRVPGAVQSLLLSDMAVFVFRPGDPSLTDLSFRGLSEIVDSIVVDSATFTIPTALLDLLATLSAPHLHGTLHDLNWQRLLPWRQAVARAFDPADARATLQHIQEVEITHANARNQALLAAGWLATCLGWQAAPGSDPDSLTFRAKDQPVRVRLRSAPDEWPGLKEIVLKAATETFRSSLTADGNFIMTGDGIQHVLRIPMRADAALLGAIFDNPERDEVFERSLSIATAFVPKHAPVATRVKIEVQEDAPALAREAARRFLSLANEAIRQRGLFSVALSGGSTPKSMYQFLAESPQREGVNWSKVHIFWGDERNVPISDTQSNQRMAHDVLLDKIPIPLTNVHSIPTGQIPGPQAAVRYAEELRAFFKPAPSELPRFDLILLGLGEDGHTASLFPHSAALNADDQALFVANSIETLNTTRLTLTAGVINAASNIWFLVSGSAKAEILYEVFAGPLRPNDLPAQSIKTTQGKVIVLADRDAAAKLG